MNLRRTRPLVAVLVAAVVGLGGLALTGASATPADAPFTHPVSLTAHQATSNPFAVPDDQTPTAAQAAQSLYVTDYRTINRWSDATTTFFTKYDGFVGTQLMDQAQRGIGQSMQMAIGNFFAAVTANITRFAVTFDAVDSVGASIDGVTRILIHSLFSTGAGAAASGLFVTVIIAVFIITIVRSLRAGSTRLLLRRMFGLCIVFGLLFAMSAQALANPPASSDGTYRPLPLTPGWVVKTVNDGVSYLAELPAQGFVDGIQPLITTSSSSTADGALSCAKLTDQMQKQLANIQSTASIAGNSGLVAVTSVTDSLWDSTGLTTWQKIQTGFNNPYGAVMYCRILDTRTAQATPSDSAFLTAAGESADWNSAITSNAARRAPFAPDTAANAAASYVAWAACEATGVSSGTINWQWRAGWQGFQGGTGPLDGATMDSSNANQYCSGWWNATTGNDGSAQSIPSVFNVSGDRGWIDDHVRNAQSPDQVRDFLYALTGVNASGGATATWAYSVSSFLQFIAFAVLSVIAIIAKLGAVMFMVALWFILVGAMFAENSGDRLLRSFNRFLGLTILAAMTTVIMTFVVLFARTLIALGDTLFGAGTVFGMVWAGFSPLAALLLVHILFKNVFRLPSPVTVSGARAWGRAGAAGSLGAAAAAGAGGFAGSRLGSFARSQGRIAQNAALHKVSGGRLGRLPGNRRSGMGAAAAPKVRSDAAAAPAAAALSVAALAKAERASAKAQRAQAALAERAELDEARSWYRAQYGTAAPGDLQGQAHDRAAKVSAAVASTPLARELQDRRGRRAELRDARREGNTEALEAISAREREKVSRATAVAAAVMDSPAAIANRAKLGVGAATDATRAAVRTGADRAQDAAMRAWNTPKAVGARADAAIIAGQARRMVAYVKESDVAAHATIAGRYATAPLRAGAQTVRAVANQKKDNAAVLAEFRAAREAERSRRQGERNVETKRGQ
ncbi:MAG: hypothetical protein CMH36_08795 [Microbacterium sp.]|nr:hypothetical protein [Microbacterium sp.]